MYKTVFEHLPVAAVYLDNAGKIVLWNRMAEKLLGYKSKYIIGENISIIIPDRFKARQNAGYAAAIKMGKTKFENGESLKAKAIKKDGDKVIINVRMAMIKDNETTAQ